MGKVGAEMLQEHSERDKTACLANQDRNDSPTHPSVLLSCELTSAQASLFMLGSGVCTAPFSLPLGFEMTLQG